MGTSFGAAMYTNTYLYDAAAAAKKFLFFLAISVLTRLRLIFITIWKFFKNSIKQFCTILYTFFLHIFDSKMVYSDCAASIRPLPLASQWYFETSRTTIEQGASSLEVETLLWAFIDSFHF